jgi:hypothetical protein
MAARTRNTHQGIEYTTTREASGNRGNAAKGRGVRNRRFLSSDL